MTDHPESTEPVVSGAASAEGEGAPRPRRRGRRGGGARAEGAGAAPAGDSGESAAGAAVVSRAERAPSAGEGGDGGGGDAGGASRAADAPADGGDGGEGGGERRSGKGPRGRFGRRRGRGGRGEAGEGPAAGGDGPAGASAGGSAAGGPPDAPADPEQVIPVYSRQARIGTDANDPRRRKGGRDARAARALPDEDAPKLHKLLADAGIGSRREMEELIIAGRVSVNGQPAHVGQRIGPTDQIRVNGRPLRVRLAQQQARAPKVLLYHKQPGEICSRDDPGQRATVFERLPKVKAGRWVAVGRLDFNTEGLLIFTTSGEIANKLMHPRYGWEREYAVRILGRVDDATRERLLEGVPLEDGPAAFSAIEDVGGDGANHWYRVVISEGRNREVRRIFEAVGLTVSRLVRIRFGPIGLPRGLARGRWVELSEPDALMLAQLLKQADREKSPGAKREGAAPVIDEDGDDDAFGAAAGDAPPRAGRGDDDEERPPRDDDDFDRDADHDDELEDEDDRQPAFLAQVEPEGGRGKRGVNLEDDDWQPTAADAHLSGITRAVRKTVPRGQRFGAGSGFGQPGLPATTPRPPGGGQGRRGRKRGAPGGFGAGGGAGAGGARFGAGSGFPSGGVPGGGKPAGGARGNRGGGQGGGARGGQGGGGGGGGGGRGPGGNRSGQGGGGGGGRSGGGRRRGPAGG